MSIFQRWKLRLREDKILPKITGSQAAEPGLKLGRWDPKILALNHSHQAQSATHYLSPQGTRGVLGKGRSEG